MSDTPDERMTELSKKIGICNKNVKALIEMVKTLTEKIETSLLKKHQRRKRRLMRYFKKKQIGRPAGDSFDSKQKTVS